MQVLKFGGTSVGSPQRMREVAGLINDGQPKIVVLSAVSGTTNKLVALANSYQENLSNEAAAQLLSLREEYASFTSDLFSDAGYLQRANDIVGEHMSTIARLGEGHFGPREEKVVLAQGELISTALFQLYLESQQIPSLLLSALDFMRTNANNEPDRTFLRTKLTALLSKYDYVPTLITQGYICLNEDGEVDNLQRGGSDYTATLVGAAIQAQEVQIWTDIDGMHNNDPRVVKGTRPVRKVSYREAAELAYFGAKILHPTCVIPAEEEQVPIRLKNTFAPEAEGTLISSQSSGRSITAIAAKDGITAIRIRSGRMLNAYGFLRRVFEVFEQYRTPIDMITTSEISVSLTIDNTTYQNRIMQELEQFGTVSYDDNQTIICIVGDHLGEQTGSGKIIFGALKEIPIRMVSYGGSDNNISLLIDRQHKEAALQALHVHLFEQQEAALLQ